MLLLFKRGTSLSALNPILFPRVSVTSPSETVPVCNNGAACTILLKELSNRSKLTLFLSLLHCILAVSRVSITHVAGYRGTQVLAGRVPLPAGACGRVANPTSSTGAGLGPLLPSLPGELLGSAGYSSTRHSDPSLVNGDAWGSYA